MVTNVGDTGVGTAGDERTAAVEGVVASDAVQPVVAEFTRTVSDTGPTISLPSAPKTGSLSCGY
ncbi:hypothetical protein GCM10022226_04050 [Sphaerisporangium flaviroseum]|uniref:Uncharacterized protein n=1 Tax=Sphaerisporangium flaviroseum TaxID=509199 RepID=A0ABP7HBM8_9ACTN